MRKIGFKTFQTARSTIKPPHNKSLQKGFFKPTFDRVEIKGGVKAPEKPDIRVLQVLAEIPDLSESDFKNIASLLDDEKILTAVGIDSQKLGRLISEYKNLLQTKTKSGEEIFLTTKPNTQEKTKVVRMSAVKNILGLKYSNPQEYLEMMEILKLVQEGLIPPYIITKLSAKGKISPLVKTDIEKMINGKSIIQTFETEKEAFLRPNVGEVVEVGNRLFVHEGYRLTELSMDKKTYLKLFPPVTRFAMAQGNIRDCHLIAQTINGLMIKPFHRAALYKLFKQVGDDVVVTLPGFSKFPRLFKNAQVKLPEETEILKGALGFQMLEQTYLVAKFFKEKPEILLAGNHVALADVMNDMQGGKVHQTLNEIFDIHQGEEFDLIPDKESCRKYHTAYMAAVDLLPNEYIKKSRPLKISMAENILNKYGNDSNYLFTASTIQTHPSAGPLLDKDLRLQTSHAYTIVKTDHKTRTITISNPWNTADWLEISYDKFFKTFKSLGVINLEKAFSN